MATAPAHPAAVLDYAEPAPQNPVVRSLRAAAMVLFCVVLLGGAAYLFQPARYRSTAIVQVGSPPPRPLDGVLSSRARIYSQKGAVATGLLSPANLSSAAASLASQGVSITPAEIAERIDVQPIPDSRLVAISFDDPTPANAPAVVHAVMISYTSYAGRGTTPAAAASPPTQHRMMFYPVAGAAVGLLFGVFIVARRWR